MGLFVGFFVGRRVGLLVGIFVTRTASLVSTIKLSPESVIAVLISSSLSWSFNIISSSSNISASD